MFVNEDDELRFNLSEFCITRLQMYENKSENKSAYILQLDKLFFRVL